MEPVWVVDKDAIEIWHDEDFCRLDTDTYWSLETVVIKLDPEIVVVFPSSYLEVCFILLVSDAEAPFRAEHHLVALHQVEHYVF